MIYFEASVIYSGIINALLLGMLFGGIYGSLCSLNNGIMRFLSVILFLFLSHKECRKRLSNFRQSREKSKIVNEIFDFLFFLSAGVL